MELNAICFVVLIAQQKYSLQDIDRPLWEDLVFGKVKVKCNFSMILMRKVVVMSNHHYHLYQRKEDPRGQVTKRNRL